MFDSEWQRVMTAETPAPRDPYADVPHPAELAEAERATGGGKRPSKAELLVSLALELYRYVVTSDGLYGVPMSGSPVAVPLRATHGPSSAGSVRQRIAAELYERHGMVASESALAEALTTVEAQVVQHAPEATVHLRIAAGLDGSTWLDLGRPDGLCVHITPGRWELATPPPGGPLFRRTRLVGQLPEPVRPVDWRAALDELRELVNASAEGWGLMVGWLLAAITPEIPRPVAYLTGPQGTGKSSAARMLVRLIDGAPAGTDSPVLRSQPESVRDLAVTTAAGWVLALDNISGISGWLSDALCRVVTGDAYTARSLYSDTDVSLLSYQRPVLLTSIDAGALRGDLAERIVPIHLEPIPADRRLSDRSLREAYRQAHPRILGGLLTLASLVMAALPEARRALVSRPRMADFAELLAALDLVTGWRTLPAYLAGLDELAADVVDGSPVASVLRSYLDTVRVWEGTPSDALAALREHAGSLAFEKGWPRTPKALGGAVRRVAPALRALGYTLDGLDKRRKYKGNTAWYWAFRAPDQPTE